jgi:hypothetical protein
MPGIFQGDILILNAIQLGIEDMRKNPWLIQHMLEDLALSPYLKEKYGQKQIDACKEWFSNNQIDVYMYPRDDRDRTPCVTITMNSSNEKPEMKTEGDLSPFTKILYPNEIGKPIPYVVKPFLPTDYNELTGGLSVPNTVDLSLVAPKMILVNPADGTGYVIQHIMAGQLFIGPNQAVSASELGIIPQFQYYEARIERSFFEESYAIECHASGDIQTVMWLWSIVMYSLLRYRQSLLESNGFAESVLSSGPPGLNMMWSTEGGEKIYSRNINLIGQVQQTWIKAPHRIIENVRLGQPVDCTFANGIKILSNLNSPAFIEPEQQLWTTVQDLDGGEEE